MPIELGGIVLYRIHRMSTSEQTDFVAHRVPGLDGDISQDMGRPSVKIMIEGIFYGESALDDMERLREFYKAREPMDFLADLTGEAYFAQVLLEEFAVRQEALSPEQFSYHLVIAEYVEPPEPTTDIGLESPDIVDALAVEAEGFMDLIQLPDLLSIPNFGDPTEPLQSVLDGIKGSLESLTDTASNLSDLYGEEE